MTTTLRMSSPRTSKPTFLRERDELLTLAWKLTCSESSTTSSSTTPSAPLTKSARKRLNKQARAASASNDKSGSGSETVQEAVPSAKEVQQEAAAVAETTQEKATSVVNGVKATLMSTVNGAAASLPTSVEEVKDQAAKVAGDAKATLDKAAEAVSPRSIGSSFTPVPEKPYTPSTNGERKSSFSQPPSTKFAPDLPEDLPEPKGDALPTNRKRKTPKEFGSASSPTKLGVKFEDGVAPGEGKVGEKVIKPKARQNVVERTVMTFVMIAGFIGESNRATGNRGAELITSVTLRRSPLHDHAGACVPDVGVQGNYGAVRPSRR